MLSGHDTAAAALHSWSHGSYDCLHKVKPERLTSIPAGSADGLRGLQNQSGGRHEGERRHAGHVLGHVSRGMGGEIGVDMIKTHLYTCRIVKD